MADNALHLAPRHPAAAAPSNPTPCATPTPTPHSHSNTPSSPASSRPLPHHKLLAWQVARDFLLAVQACSLRSAHLRDQALRAAQSAALNTAEGAGRVSRADKARAFAIARAECVEAAAAVEIAALSGEVGEARLAEVLRLADLLVALLTGLAR